MNTEEATPTPPRRNMRRVYRCLLRELDAAESTPSPIPVREVDSTLQTPPQMTRPVSPPPITQGERPVEDVDPEHSPVRPRGLLQALDREWLISEYEAARRAPVLNHRRIRMEPIPASESDEDDDN